MILSQTAGADVTRETRARTHLAGSLNRTTLGRKPRWRVPGESVPDVQQCPSCEGSLTVRRSARSPIRLSVPAVAILSLVAGLLAAAQPAAADHVSHYGSSYYDRVLDGSTTALASPLPDKTSVRVRITHPTTRSKPTGGYPLVVELHGTGANRCSDFGGGAGSTPMLSHAELASAGYVVLSFNQRGMPRSIGANWGTGCTDTAAEIEDGINDTGADGGGSVDSADVSALITWARDQVAWSGFTVNCSSACVNENKVGVIGLSQGGTRTWMMGVSKGTCDKAFDCRIKALVPISAWNPWTTLSALSSDGTNPVPHAWSENELFSHLGMGAMTTDARFVPSLAGVTQGKFLPRTNHAASTSGASLTVTAPPYFAPGDIGQKVLVPGAKTGPATLEATITAVNSTGTVATVSPAADISLSTTATWLGPPGNQSNTGSMSSGSTTLTISGSPGFTKADEGDEIAVTGAGSTTGANDTLWTKIQTVTSSTTATLADAADADGTSSARVRWGAQGWFDRHTIVDDDLDVSKVEKWDVPTFVVQGWYDGDGAIHNQAAIEAFKRLPSGATYANSVHSGDTAKYLYLGGCTHYPDFCPSTTRTQMRDAILRFFDRYLEGDANARVGPVTSNATGRIQNCTPPNDPDCSVLTLTDTSTTAFAPADVGKAISVPGVGSGGSTLTTTIQSFNASDSVTLATPASLNGTNKTVTWGCPLAGPCVTYTVPTKYVDGTVNAWTVAGAQQSSTSWPPGSPGSGHWDTKLYLHDGASRQMTTTIGGNVASYETLTNNLAGPSVNDLCADVGYEEGVESLFFDTENAATDYKTIDFKADLWLSTDEPRLQVYADLYLTDSNGNELGRVWTPDGRGVVIPVQRNLGPSQLGHGTGQRLRFVFKPGGVAVTVAQGQRLRLKIATNFRNGARATEPLYTPDIRLYHDGGSYASSLTVTTIL